MTNSSANHHNPKPTNPGRIYEALIFGFAAVWFMVLGRRGITPLDEGYYQFQGLMLLKGVVPYRDLHMTVPPAGFLIQAALIKLFGVHLIVGRIYVMVQGLLIVAMALALGRRLLSFPYSLAPGALYITYSVALAGYPHYNIDSAFFLMAALLVLDTHLRRPRPGWMFAAGALGALASLSKQSHVLPAAALVLITLGLRRRDQTWPGLIAEAALAGAGFLVAAALVIAPFAGWHALEEMRECLSGMAGIKRPHLLIVLPRAMALGVLGLIAVRAIIALSRTKRFVRHQLQPGLTLDLWGAVLLGAVGGAYFFPTQAYVSVLISVGTLSLLLWVRPAPEAAREWVLVRAYGLLSFFITIISTVDLGHILLASIGFVYPAALLVQQLHRRDRRHKKILPVYYLAATTLALVWVVGAYFDWGVPHLAFAQGPKWHDRTKVDLPGMEGILLDPATADELTDTVTWVTDHTALGEPIFVYPWDMVIYLLADRPPSTYQTVFYYELVTPKLLVRSLADLDRVRPRVAVARLEGDGFKRVASWEQGNAVEGYLRAHYDVVHRFGDYAVMTRKAEKEEESNHR